MAPAGPGGRVMTAWMSVRATDLTPHSAPAAAAGVCRLHLMCLMTFYPGLPKFATLGNTLLPHDVSFWHFWTFALLAPCNCKRLHAPRREKCS